LRPITCFSTTFKLLTGIIADSTYEDLDQECLLCYMWYRKDVENTSRVQKTR